MTLFECLGIGSISIFCGFAILVIGAVIAHGDVGLFACGSILVIAGLLCFVQVLRCLASAEYYRKLGDGEKV